MALTIKADWKSRALTAERKLREAREALERIALGEYRDEAGHHQYRPPEWFIEIARATLDAAREGELLAECDTEEGNGS